MRFLDYPDKPLIWMKFVMIFLVEYRSGWKHEKLRNRITICGTAGPQPVSDSLITPSIPAGLEALHQRLHPGLSNTLHATMKLLPSLSANPIHMQKVPLAPVIRAQAAIILVVGLT